MTNNKQKVWVVFLGDGYGNGDVYVFRNRNRARKLHEEHKEEYHEEFVEAKNNFVNNLSEEKENSFYVDSTVLGTPCGIHGFIEEQEVQNGNV